MIFRCKLLQGLSHESQAPEFFQAAPVVLADGNFIDQKFNPTEADAVVKDQVEAAVTNTTDEVTGVTNPTNEAVGDSPANN